MWLFSHLQGILKTNYGCWSETDLVLFDLGPIYTCPSTFLQWPIALLARPSSQADISQIFQLFKCSLINRCLPPTPTLLMPRRLLSHWQVSQFSSSSRRPKTRKIKFEINFSNLTNIISELADVLPWSWTWLPMQMPEDQIWVAKWSESLCYCYCWLQELQE